MSEDDGNGEMGQTMRDVDHTPPHGTGAADVWTRGQTRLTDAAAAAVAADGEGESDDHESVADEGRYE